jgi:hypothetical protein
MGIRDFKLDLNLKDVMLDTRDSTSLSATSRQRPRFSDGHFVHRAPVMDTGLVTLRLFSVTR